MYDRGTPIPDDAQELGRVCGCSTRRFKQVRDKLASEGKITLKDGCISNNRFEKQVKKEEIEHRKLSENAAKSHLKRRENEVEESKNNDLEKKGQKHNQIPDTRYQKERYSTEDGFDEWYAEYPKKVGKGQARVKYHAACKKTAQWRAISVEYLSSRLAKPRNISRTPPHGSMASAGPTRIIRRRKPTHHRTALRRSRAATPPHRERQE